MAALDKELIKYLAELSRIHCTEEEEAGFLEDLSRIISYVDQLAEIDTEKVEPCNSVLKGLTNVTRNDEVGDLLPRETFLENAPDQIDGMVRVPEIIKKSSK